MNGNKGEGESGREKIQRSCVTGKSLPLSSRKGEDGGITERGRASGLEGSLHEIESG